MTGGDGNKARQALAALADLARGSVRPPAPAKLAGGLRALRARMGSERSRGRARAVRRAVLRWSVVATAVGASALVAVGVLHRERVHAPAAAPALAYRVEGGSIVDGGYLRESGRAGIKLSFAEGTEFVLTPGTRGRLRAVDAAGARIAIEHGNASFRITPAIDNRWLVDVGPFLVTVKGTVFTASWDAAAARFELNLRHGRVTVSGPVNGGEIALRAGQRLQVDLPHGETKISEPQPGDEIEVETGPARAAVEPSTEEQSAASVKPVGRVGRPAETRSVARADGDRGWAQALAAGDLDRILAEAERAGVKATLDVVSSDDLVALADAARYRRRMALSRAALLAERRRFPDSPRALDATFLLGRVEEASDDGLARAVQWYDEYLRRAPAGTYASEALGRKMTLTSKLEGASRARPVAEEYLRRFPEGTYAGPARAFVRAP
jgi:hypothetical protein